MWGLLFFVIVGLGCFINSCKTDYESNKRREQGRKNGKETYFDYNGKCRLVSNNHQIDRTLRVVNGELDHVLIDAKTEQILHNYSEDKRQEETHKTIKARNEDIEAKREAKEQGRYFYTAKGESRIKEGFYEDSLVSHFIYHDRRVSDDLLLGKDSREGQPIKEGRCGFYIWAGNAEKCNDLTTLRGLAAKNWQKVFEWNNKINRDFWRENYFPTPVEVEAYARSLSAYFPDTIRNGRPLLLTEVDDVAMEIFKSNLPKNCNEDNMAYRVNRIQEKLIDAGYLIQKDILRKMMIEHYNMKKEE